MDQVLLQLEVARKTAIMQEVERFERLMNTTFGQVKWDRNATAMILDHTWEHITHPYKSQRLQFEDFLHTNGVAFDTDSIPFNETAIRVVAYQYFFSAPEFEEIQRKWTNHLLTQKLSKEN